MRSGRDALDAVYRLLGASASRHAAGGTLPGPRVDIAPAAVHATLLDEGRHLGSVHTMYRLLVANSAQAFSAFCA